MIQQPPRKPPGAETRFRDDMEEEQDSGTETSPLEQLQPDTDAEFTASGGIPEEAETTETYQPRTQRARTPSKGRAARTSTKAAPGRAKAAKAKTKRAATKSARPKSAQAKTRGRAKTAPKRASKTQAKTKGRAKTTRRPKATRKTTRRSR